MLLLVILQNNKNARYMHHNNFLPCYKPHSRHAIEQNIKLASHYWKQTFYLASIISLFVMSTNNRFAHGMISLSEIQISLWYALSPLGKPFRQL